MQDKIKYVLIALGVFFLISVIVNIQVFNAKKVVERERDAVKEENTTLLKKIDENIKENKRLEAKINLLTKDFEKVSADLAALTKEREELVQQFEQVKKEKKELEEKVKSLTPEEGGGRPPAVTAVADSYWAGILKKKADLELQVESLKGEINKVRLSNAQLLTEKGDMELEVSNVVRQNDDLKRQIEYIGSNQKSIDTLTQDLVREKNDKFQIQNSLSLIRSENTLLRRQLKSLGKRNIDLEKKVVEMQGKNKNLEDSFAKVESLLKDQMLKMNSLKGTLEDERSKALPPIAYPDQAPSAGGVVELPPIVVSPRGAAAPLGSLIVAGKVVSIDRENNFAIIDLGENSGVKKGDSFQIYRSGKPIASVVVIEARRDISACDIKKESTSIQPGDTVK